MGTSQSLKPSIKGNKNWGDLTRTASLITNKKNYSEEKIGNLFNKYSEAKKTMNTYNNFANSGIKTAKNLASLFNSVSINGLGTTLNNFGFDLDKMSVEETVNFIINHCTENGSDFDDITAKAANEDLLKELFENTDSVEDVEKIISENNDEELKNEYLYRYFGYYIYEDISLILYEKIYNRYLRNIKMFLSKLKNIYFLISIL